MHLHTYRPDESFESLKRQSLTFFIVPNLLKHSPQTWSTKELSFSLIFTLLLNCKIKKNSLHPMATCPVVDDCAI